MQITSMTKDTLIKVESCRNPQLLKLTTNREAYLSICDMWDALKKLLCELKPGGDPGLDRRQKEALAAMEAGVKYAERKLREG